jgi:hypothetical protein
MEGKVMCPPETTAGIRDALASVVKPIDIVDDAAIFEQYCTDHSFVAGCRPQFLLYPENKEEVQEIVRLAGRIGRHLSYSEHANSVPRESYRIPPRENI